MSFKKISLLALLALTSVSGLASCDGASSASTIVLSGPAEAQDFTIARAEEWAAANPKADGSSWKFSYSVIGEDKIDSNVPDWSNSGAPDVYMFANDKTQNLVQNNAIAPVTDANIEAMQSADYSIQQSYLDTVTFNDTVYGYPYTLNGYCFWYNKDKVESYIAEDGLTGEDADYKNWTMDQWLAIAEAHGQDIDYPLVTPYYGAAALTSFGARWSCTFNANGALTEVTSNFSDENGYKAGEVMREWHQDYKKALVDVDGTQQAPSDSSSVLATVNGAWALADSAGGESAYAADDIQCLVIPSMRYTNDQGEEEIAKTNAFTGSKAFGVNPNKSLGDTERLSALHSLALYLVRPDVQQSRYETNSSWLPTTTAIEIEDNKCVAALTEQLSYGIPQANLPTNIWTAPGTFVTGLVDGTTTKDNLQASLEQLDSTLANIQ